MFTPTIVRKTRHVFPQAGRHAMYVPSEGSAVKESLMDIICCPIDKEPLDLTIETREGEEILEGTLTCTDCGEVYPIEDGIPNLLPPDMREETPA